jgi:hypothetical protein
MSESVKRRIALGKFKPPTLGKHHSEETKRKISKALIGRHRTKESIIKQKQAWERKRILGYVSPLKGRPKSEEHKLKLRVKKKIKPTPELIRKRIESRKKYWEMHPEELKQYKLLLSKLAKELEHKPRFPKPRYDDGIGYKLRTLPELYVALWLQDSKLPRFSDGKVYHYEEPIAISNKSKLYPDFTLATNNTIRIEVSGATYSKWLNNVVKRAIIIKSKFPKDKYILVTYKRNIDKLPKSCFDKILPIEGIIEYLKLHNLMSKAKTIIKILN